jgi:hypothetical protein
VKRRASRAKLLRDSSSALNVATTQRGLQLHLRMQAARAKNLRGFWRNL